jgi:hypothetical protein
MHDKQIAATALVLASKGDVVQVFMNCLQITNYFSVAMMCKSMF